MIESRKLGVLLLILIILNITPAFAFSLNEIQKEGEYVEKYTNESGWYKFCNFIDFCHSVFKILAQMNSLETEMDGYTKQVENQKLENEKNNNNFQVRKDSLKTLSDYYDTKTSQNDSVTDPKTKNATNKKSAKNNSDVKTKTNESKTNSTESTILTNNDTSKNNTPSKDPKIILLDNANEVKNDLNESGIHIEVKNVKISNLKNKSIVQLLNDKGYVKYMVYLGIKTVDNETYVKIFNGQEDSLILFNKFKKDYTGLILEFEGSNTDTIQTECDVAQKIYDDKLASLESNINFHNNWLITANVIKGIGITISILVMILTVVASILLLAPEPAITKASALVCYKFALVGILLAAALYVAGFSIESVSSCYKNDYLAEMNDLQNFKL
jgi:hypothetical protein